MKHTLTISQSDPGQRLDRWLKDHFPTLSYSVMQKWLRTGQIRLNGKRVKGSDVVKDGDQLRLPPQIQFLQELPAKSIPQQSPQTLELLKNNIVFEDERCCVLNKPIGLAVQGGTDMRDYVDLYLGNLVSQNAEPLRLTHRLDKDTSGVLLLAKTKEAARYFTNLFKEGRIQKRYLAIVVGNPQSDSGTITAPIHKKIDSSLKNETPQKKLAITEYRVLATSSKGLSLLELLPKTGRMHQLRIHCALNLGCPILGDGKYGGKRAQPFAHRLSIYLHAFQMEVPAETEGSIYQFTAPIPPAFQDMITECFDQEILF